MSVSAAHADASYREVRDDLVVFTIRDVNGYPAPEGGKRVRAMPFWSKRSRAQKVIDAVPAYGDFQIVEISMADFRDRWLAGLDRDGLAVGLNWSGVAATGYDLTPVEVLQNLIAGDDLE